MAPALGNRAGCEEIAARLTDGTVWRDGGSAKESGSRSVDSGLKLAGAHSTSVSTGAARESSVMTFTQTPTTFAAAIA